MKKVTLTKMLWKQMPLLLAVVLSLIILCSCSSNNQRKEDTFSRTETATEVSTTPVAEMLTIAEDKKIDYVITYLQGSDQSIKLAVKQLQSEIEKLTGAEIEIGTESSGKSAADYPEKEIIVGESIREEFADFYEKIGYGDWAVGVVGNKILIAGKNVSSVLDALDYFCETFLTSENPTIASDYFYLHSAAHTVENIKIDDIDIGEYKIVYNGVGVSAEKQAANDLYRYIARSSGIEVEVIKYKSSLDLTKCIVIGENSSHSSQTKNYGECKVYAENGTIYVDGTDICGLESGVSYLASVLTDAETVNLDSSTLSFTDSLQERETYITDSSAFLPCYRYSYSLSEEEISFENKVKLLNDSSGRTMVLAHRGEHIYYPENSLEANISAYFCGADSTEVDIVQTKDGVWICMHDSSLDRTTNFSQMKGQNGLPMSSVVSDWTLEQIRQLRLVDTYGEVTPFMIPTLEEILVACNNKIFVHLDKTFSYQDDIFPLMEKLGTYNCVYLSNHVKYDDIVTNKDYFKDKNIKLQSLLRTWDSQTFEMYATKLTSEDAAITPALVYKNDYEKNTDSDKECVQKFAGRLRIATWMMAVDNEYYWREAQSYGFNILMTNDPINLLSDIQE